MPPESEARIVVPAPTSGKVRVILEAVVLRTEMHRDG